MHAFYEATVTFFFNNQELLVLGLASLALGVGILLLHAAQQQRELRVAVLFLLRTRAPRVYAMLRCSECFALLRIELHGWEQVRAQRLDLQTEGVRLRCPARPSG